METERQRRASEELKTLEDYKDTLMLLRELTIFNDKSIKESIKLLGLGVKEKIKYLMGISKQYRKKQRFFSRWKDKRLEKMIEKTFKEQEEDEQEACEVQDLKEQLVNANSLIERQQALLDEHNLSLISPPEVNSQQAMIADKSNDDCLQF